MHVLDEFVHEHLLLYIKLIPLLILRRYGYRLREIGKRKQ